ncbi:MAG: hypothetical protein AMXMBFR84_13580 [Candidatus Hydrogenedentota bacterium]
MLFRAGIVTLAILAGCAAQAVEVTFSWRGLNRTWIGPDFWANRLQDWQVANDRLECVEGDAKFPYRTVHALTYRLSDKPGRATLKAVIGPINPSDGEILPGFAGFLFGAGNSSIDPRLTALVHQRPATDGGLLAVVDRAARIRFYDFSVDGVQAKELGPDGAAAAPAMANLKGKEVQLAVEIVHEDSGIRIHALLLDATTGETINERRLSGLGSEFADGGIALLSHLDGSGADGGFYFREWAMEGDKIAHMPAFAFGPIMAVQYTVQNHLLKLTAQSVPLGAGDSQTADLQVLDAFKNEWRTVATAHLTPLSCTFPFRVENWDSQTSQSFRILYPLSGDGGTVRSAAYEGTIVLDPVERDNFVVAAFTGHKCFTEQWHWNHNGIWFPHREVVDGVAHFRPDLLFFSGDQIYEGDLTPPDRRSLDKSMLDYLYKWYRWCWAFGELSRTTPCICIPDDHDVYHGNIWGAGGRHAEKQDDGGYTMPAEFVNAVQRTQTSHLPDPYDPTPVEQGIGVYYTALNYGGVSFAVIEDRKWKSSPTVAAPECQFVNGWPQNPDCDPVTDADVPGAELLGERQLAFLDTWATDGAGVFKAVLSQTIFANVATLPGGAMGDQVLPKTPMYAPDFYPTDWQLAEDADSNGWPQTGRNKALEAMRKGHAVHIAGDQHLGSVIQYGIREFGDAGYAFCVPSIANTWPRRWFPPQPGANPLPHSPRNTGDFLDGFGNRMTVFAVSNPSLTGVEPVALHDRAPGYGIVRFDKAAKTVTFECWPRSSNPTQPDAPQYPGWPVTVKPFED